MPLDKHAAGEPHTYQERVKLMVVVVRVMMVFVVKILQNAQILNCIYSNICARSGWEWNKIM